MSRSVAILEISALGAALVVLDRIHKSAAIELLQAELNDFYGYVLKVTGSPSSLRSAVDEAHRLARSMAAPCVATILDAPDQRAWPTIESKPEYQPLIEQNVVFVPSEQRLQKETSKMPSAESPYAIGLIETQGFTAVIEAIDTACKAADVEVIGKEKLGGGYITVLIKGDVAAVTAAVESGKTKVEGLGKLIAAHVIARPSQSILSLLPQPVN
jgi:microcompartment protein CcmL/EutN